MTIDDAIKRYTSNAFYEKSDGNLQGHLEFEQLAEWLKELKQLREQTRWIPVSERLPEKDGEYLVTVQGSIAGHKYIDTCHFTGHVDCFERFGIVAWMPLPEPYKEESEE